MPQIHDKPQRNSDGDDEKPYPKCNLEANDQNLLYKPSSINANTTLIPLPGTSSLPPMKSNIPSGPQPLNHFDGRPSANAQQLRKKRIAEREWELTNTNGSAPKRQNTNNQVFYETEADRASDFGSYRHKMDLKKSEQLKEGLAGGSADKNLKPQPKIQEQFFDVPYHMYQQYQNQKKQDNRASRPHMSSSVDSANEDDLEIEGGPESDLQTKQSTGIASSNSLALDRFRRGHHLRPASQSKNSLIIELSPNNTFKVYEGKRELEEFRFSLGEVKQVLVNDNYDYIHIILNRTRADFPFGERIWCALQASCPDLDKRFFQGKNICEQKQGDLIARREEQMKNYSHGDANMHPMHIANRSSHIETPSQSNTSISSKKYLPGHSTNHRNMRSRNAEAMKRITPLEIKEVDDYPLSPTGFSPARPHYIMSQAERNLPSLVWPPSGKKRVTVDYQDLERLEEEQFLNDNIINFYLRFLEEEISRVNPDLARQTHFFNTFLYERLMQKTADKKGLMKWTARIDLFTKRYVIIPINENAHWYLAIICNLHHLEEKLQSKDACEANETTVNAASPQDSPGEEEEVSSETEPRSAIEVDFENSDRMEIEDSNSQRPVTAQDQLLSEASIMDLDSPSSPMDHEHISKGDEEESEWPNEEGLEGASHQHIADITGFLSRDAERSHGDVANNVDEPAIRRVKKAKKRPPKPKKQPKPVDPDLPTIFILDSLSTNGHSKTFTVLRDYLEEEAYQKKQWNVDRRDINGVYAKVPQQRNWCDCGVYLLHYVERFLQRPEDFTQEFLQKEDCEQKFDRNQFSGMRQRLKVLIKKLHAEQHGLVAKNPVSDDVIADVQTRAKSLRDPSEQAEEIKHDKSHRGSANCDINNGNNSSELAELGQKDGVVTDTHPGRKFTPDNEDKNSLSPGLTRPRGFSVEISNRRRFRKFHALLRLSSESPEPKGEPFLGKPQSPSPSEADDYTTSAHRSPLIGGSPEL